MSTNTKRLLLIIGIAAAFCLVAVGVAAGGMYLLGNQLKDSIVTDKAKVQQMAHSFVNYELPSGYNEQMGMNFMIYKMIVISPDESSTDQPSIFLAEFQSNNLSSDQMSQQMQQSAQQQSGSNSAKFKVVDTRNVTINGQQTTLTVSEGSDAKGVVVIRQWVTAFQEKAKSGVVLIMIQGPVSGWDDATLNTFLDSISS